MPTKEEMKGIISSNISLLKNIAFKITKDPEKARDLLQSATVVMIKNSSKFKAGTNFKNWAFKVTKNTYLNYVNWENREKERIARAAQDEKSSLTKILFPHPESDLDAEQIMQLIECLKPKNKEIFLLYTDGYGSNEIGSQLGMKPETVKTIIHRTKLGLKEQLAPIYTHSNIKSYML